MESSISEIGLTSNNELTVIIERSVIGTKHQASSSIMTIVNPYDTSLSNLGLASDGSGTICIEMASRIVEEYGDKRAAEALQQGLHNCRMYRAFC